MTSTHGNQAAFHKICDEKVFPMFYHNTYEGSSRRKRIAGLYYCVSCEVPTYSVNYRFITPEERKQKTIEVVE